MSDRPYDYDDSVWTDAERKDPGYRVIVVHDGVGIVRGGIGIGVDVTFAVMDAYDMIVNGMEYGSEFLSTEEVQSIAKLGAALGAKPLEYKGKVVVVK